MIPRLRTFALLALLLMTIPLSGHTGGRTIFVSVIRPYEGNPQHEVWLQTVLPAHFTFRVDRGSMPDPGVMQCEQKNEMQYSPDRQWKWPMIVLSCKDGRELSLTGVAF
jgi:hypothetical protein